MDASTAQLYDLLVEKGFEKSRVREALSELVTNDEMDKHIEHGFDRVRADLKTELKETENRLIIWMVGLVVALGGLLIAAGAIN